MGVGLAGKNKLKMVWTQRHTEWYWYEARYEPFDGVDHPSIQPLRYDVMRDVGETD